MLSAGPTEEKKKKLNSFHYLRFESQIIDTNFTRKITVIALSIW